MFCLFMLCVFILLLLPLIKLLLPFFRLFLFSNLTKHLSKINCNCYAEALWLCFLFWAFWVWIESQNVLKKRYHPRGGVASYKPGDPGLSPTQGHAQVLSHLSLPLISCHSTVPSQGGKSLADWRIAWFGRNRKAEDTEKERKRWERERGGGRDIHYANTHPIAYISTGREIQYNPKGGIADYLWNLSPIA